MKFATKITVFFSAIILIIGAIISYLVYSTNINNLEELVNKNSETYATHVMYDIDRMFFEKHADMKALADEPILRSRTSTPKQITEILKKYQDMYRGYASFSFLNLDGIVIADTIENNIGKQHEFIGYWPGIAESKDSALAISEFEFHNLPVQGSPLCGHT